MNRLPKVINKYNIYFEDGGYGGICSEVELPELNIPGEEFRGGGMDMAVAIDLGMDIPTVTFTMEEHVAALVKKFGQVGVRGRFAAAKTNSRDPAERYLINFTGSFHQLPLGTVAPGAKSPMKGTIRCEYLKITNNGEVLAEIDAVNCTRVIGGVDQLAQVRAAIQ